MKTRPVMIYGPKLLVRLAAAPRLRLPSPPRPLPSPHTPFEMICQFIAAHKTTMTLPASAAGVINAFVLGNWNPSALATGRLSSLAPPPPPPIRRSEGIHTEREAVFDFFFFLSQRMCFLFGFSFPFVGDFFRVFFCAGVVGAAFCFFSSGANRRESMFLLLASEAHPGFSQGGGGDFFPCIVASSVRKINFT